MCAGNANCGNLAPPGHVSGSAARVTQGGTAANCMDGGGIVGVVDGAQHAMVVFVLLLHAAAPLSCRYDRLYRPRFLPSRLPSHQPPTLTLSTSGQV